MPQSVSPAYVKREIGGKETALALEAFTQRYCDAWHAQRGSWPESEALYGVPSPCIISSTDNSVFWQPKPFLPERNVNPVEQAMDIVVQPALHAFYTTQFAGDMTARFASETLTLLQTLGVKMTSGVCRKT